MHYLLIPALQKALLWFPRSGSTAVARAIVETHHADLLAAGNWSLANGVDEVPIKALCPSAASPPPGYAVAAILRDPVERFRSACAYQGKSAAEALALLAADRGRGFRQFAPIARLLPRRAKLFLFGDWEKIAAWLEVPAIAQENAASTPPPELTEAEHAAVREYYRDDLALYFELTRPTGVQVNPIALGEAHIAAQGYSATRLLKLMDLRLSGSTNPRLLAVYAWTQQVAQLALDGVTAFPLAPFSFEEVLTAN